MGKFKFKTFNDFIWAKEVSFVVGGEAEILVVEFCQQNDKTFRDEGKSLNWINDLRSSL